MQETSSSVTTREAVLGSLLAHACLIIYVLLFPGTFRPGSLVHTPRDPNEPIPVAFMTQPEPPEAPALSLGDAGRRKSGEPRPKDAPPPDNADPYSVGNTRNRFVAPPLPDKTSPAPEPGGAPSRAMTQEEAARGDPDERARLAETETEGERTEFYLPPSDKGDQPLAGGGKGGALRETLGRMSLGMSGGGAPLKFNNPTGGISGPLGGLSFETTGFDWGPYSRKIYWVIWSNWMRGWPPAAWAGLKGMVTVKFRIWKDGRISGIEVIDPSGTVAFDTCATLALEASNPLPPLPQDFDKESEGISARFLYNTDVDER
ncbi:MAG TPA: TonB family protein [Candidatus Polarisedimenticolia bacterium]|jgi:TonB family protein